MSVLVSTLPATPLKSPEIIALGVVVVAAVALVAFLRLADQRRADSRRAAWRLHFPPSVDLADVLAFLRSLQTMPLGGPLSARPAIVGEIRSSNGTLEHWLLVPRELETTIRRQVETAVSGIQIEEVTRPASKFFAARELRLSTFARPLRTADPEATVSSLLASIVGLGRDEVAVIQVVIAPHRGRLDVASGGTGSTAPLIYWVRSVIGRPTAAPPSRELREKQSEPLLSVAIRLGASAPGRQRAATLVRALRSAMRILDQFDVRLVQRSLPEVIVRRRLTAAATPIFEWPSVLNAREGALLVAWPLSDRIPGISRQRHRLLAPVPIIAASGGRVFGLSPLPGPDRPLALAAADSPYHLVVTGPTGTGKSWLLAQLIRQDMAAGRSVILFDPKGDLCRTVMGFVPGRTRTIVLDLADASRPVPVRLIESRPEILERSVDEVLQLFVDLFPGAIGPRSADILRALFYIVATNPGFAFADAPAILTNSRLRQTLTAQVVDPYHREFWRAFEAASEAERASIVAPPMNKLRGVLSDRRLRLVLGSVKATWSWDDVLEDRGVVLVNLNRGEIGSSASTLIASALMSQLWRAIQRRRARHEVSLVVDEVQDTLRSTADLADVLAMARSARVSVSAAHQNLAQLPSELRSALAANARSKVVFQCGSDDARVLAAQLGGEVTPADLQSLPAFEAYFAPCVGGAVQPPASLRTLPLPPATADPGAVLGASRARYGRDRTEVEAEMAARQLGPQEAGRVGRRPHRDQGGES